jgi:hypothetical protein
MKMTPAQRQFFEALNSEKDINKAKGESILRTIEDSKTAEELKSLILESNIPWSELIELSDKKRDTLCKKANQVKVLVRDSRIPRRDILALEEKKLRKILESASAVRELVVEAHISFNELAALDEDKNPILWHQISAKTYAVRSLVNHGIPFADLVALKPDILETLCLYYHQVALTTNYCSWPDLLRLSGTKLRTVCQNIELMNSLSSSAHFSIPGLIALDEGVQEELFKISVIDKVHSLAKDKGVRFESFHTLTKEQQLSILQNLSSDSLALLNPPTRAYRVASPFEEANRTSSTPPHDESATLMR